MEKREEEEYKEEKAEKWKEEDMIYITEVFSLSPLSPALTRSPLDVSRRGRIAPVIPLLLLHLPRGSCQAVLNPYKRKASIIPLFRTEKHLLSVCLCIHLCACPCVRYAVRISD